MTTILQICVEGNTGSTGRLAENIGIEAIRSGWKSYIAYGRFPKYSKSNLIKIGTNWDIIVHGLMTRFFDRHCLGSRFATIKLIDKIKRIKPDIIHLHHLHGYYINIEILFNYLSTISTPVVWTFHDCWSITGHCTHFDSIGCEKWKTECNCCPQRKTYPKSWFIDRSKINYHLKKKLFTSVQNMTIVSVSNWLNKIIDNSFLGNYPQKMIYNGINVNLFTPETRLTDIKQKLKLENKFVILGIASLWNKQKGFDDFISLSKYLGKDDVIVLVGLDKKQIKQLPSNIIGLMYIENQQLKEIYATADLFINLSVEETFGLTTTEALSCGTPAVVYDATACPEIIDNSTGFVVKKGDIKGLVKIIKQMKNKGKQYYSENCRKKVLTYFNSDKQCAEYLHLYQNLISNYSNIDIK